MTAPNTIKIRAHEILDAAYPVVEYAKKTIRWRLDERGVRVPRTVSEDIFNGAFDALAWRMGEPLLFVQWTSRDGVSARLNKIKANLMEALYADAPDYNKRTHEKTRVECWGYTVKGCFLVWRWRWVDRRWTDKPVGFVVSPQMSRQPKSGTILDVTEASL